MSEPSKPTGPDLAQGIPLDDLADGGMIGGHVGEEPVLLARRGDEFFAIGSACSHYGGPLAEGFAGSVTLLSSDDAAPYDRPNCSKDYLAGNAPEDWIPLKPAEFYREHAIDVALGTNVTGIDVKARQVAVAGGRNLAFDKLVL